MMKGIFYVVSLASCLAAMGILMIIASHVQSDIVWVLAVTASLIVGVIWMAAWDTQPYC